MSNGPVFVVGVVAVLIWTLAMLWAIPDVPLGMYAQFIR